MKAVLVLDMPETCVDCDLCFECRDCMRRPEDIPYDIKKFSETFIDDRMPWCPLRPLPEHKDAGTVMYKLGEPITKELADELIDFGFNECLNAITREVEA